jgi:hypothetical protein
MKLKPTSEEQNLIDMAQAIIDEKINGIALLLAKAVLRHCESALSTRQFHADACRDAARD